MFRDEFLVHVKEGGCPFDGHAPDDRRARPDRRPRQTRRSPSPSTGARSRRRKGELHHRRRRAGGHLHPALLLPPAHGAGRHVPDVPGRGDGPAWLHAAAGLLRPGRRRHGGRLDQSTRPRRPRRACSSSCSSTTRSTARSATRAASARSRTRRCRTARARAASSRRSGTWRSRSRSATSCCSTASAASSAPAAPASPTRSPARPQIDFAGRGDQIEVATFPTEPFNSYFSGNTVQICPVGALTATPYRFKARPWDLEQVESTCTTCSVGCRVAVQSSANRLTRLLGVDSDPVNQGWLCDKGRFGFESVNGDEVTPVRCPTRGRRAVDVARPRLAVVSLGVDGASSWARSARPDASSTAASPSRSSARTASWSRSAGARRWPRRRRASPPPRSPAVPSAVAVIGGARLSNEDAYAWAKLAKGVIGTDTVDAQLGDGLPAELVLGLPRATIDEACVGAGAASCSPATSARSCRCSSCACATAARRRARQLIELAPDPDRRSRTLAAATLPIRPGERRSSPGPLTGDDAAATALGSHPRAARRPTAQLEAARRCWPSTPTATASSSCSAGPRSPSRARSPPPRCACSPRRCPRRGSSPRCAGPT